MTGSDSRTAGDEPGRVGGIHLHPTAGNEHLQIDNGLQVSSVDIRGGTPSPTDYDEHTRAFQNHETSNGVRFVMGDSKYIYLYNSSSNQTIKVPRP